MQQAERPNIEAIAASIAGEAALYGAPRVVTDVTDVCAYAHAKEAECERLQEVVVALLDSVQQDERVYSTHKSVVDAREALGDRLPDRHRATEVADG